MQVLVSLRRGRAAEEMLPVLPALWAPSVLTLTPLCAEGSFLHDHFGGQELYFSSSELNLLMSLHLDWWRKQVNLFSISTVGQKKKN